MTRLIRTVAATAFAALTGIALAQGSPLTVQLGEQNKSGETGTATITSQGSKTQVVLEMKGAPAEAQPAHIHDGTCASLDPKPRIPLQNVVNGKYDDDDRQAHFGGDQRRDQRSQERGGRQDLRRLWRPEVTEPSCSPRCSPIVPSLSCLTQERSVPAGCPPSQSVD